VVKRDEMWVFEGGGITWSHSQMMTCTYELTNCIMQSHQGISKMKPATFLWLECPVRSWRVVGSNPRWTFLSELISDILYLINFLLNYSVSHKSSIQIFYTYFASGNGHFPRTNMRAYFHTNGGYCVYYSSNVSRNTHTRIFHSFSWGIFSHVTP